MLYLFFVNWNKGTDCVSLTIRENKIFAKEHFIPLVKSTVNDAFFREQIDREINVF